MEEQSLALSFGNSMTEEISGIAGEYAELGLDALVEDGLFKDIPIVSTAVAVYRIGKSIREKHHIAKLISFLDEINKGIADGVKREEYREKFASNEKFRNQELEYILILTDRYISFDKPRMLAKLYLAYLDGRLSWNEFGKYAEVIDRFLPGDFQELQKGSQEDVHHLDVSDSLLRLISIGFVMEHSKDIDVATTLGTIKIPPATKKNYMLTEFGKNFLNIMHQYHSNRM